jgi:predicted dehydrogenase
LVALENIKPNDLLIGPHSLVNPHLLMSELADLESSLSADLRFAIIGFGKMGVLHSCILNLLKSNSVKSIIDNSRFITFGVSTMLKNVIFSNNLEKILQKDVCNAVYVTTPGVSHYSIVSKLLEKGVKHIFVEKPPTINLAQLDSLLSRMEVDQNVMVGFQKRFAFTFRYAKFLIDQKVLGQVTKVSAYIKSSDMFSPTNRFSNYGRGVNLDLGVHLIDLLVWMFDISEVKEAESTSIYTTVDDFFKAKLTNSSNLGCTVEIAWADHTYRLPETSITIYGSKGQLNVTEDCVKVNCSEPHILLNDKKDLILFKTNFYQSIPQINLADPEYVLEDIHFIYSIFQSTRSLTDLRSQSQLMHIIDCMYEKAGYSGSKVLS